MRFVQYIHLIGCGGIGTWLLAPLLRFLNSEGFPGEIQLWDGDRYSIGNLSRQDANNSLLGRPKAEAQANRYRIEFPNLRIWHRNEFVTSFNAQEACFERSMVLVLVDNHPARALIARQAESLRDVCAIFAGNEMHDGNISVMLRRAGRPVTAHLLERHPEIATIRRGDREEMGCEELISIGQTQLLVTNFMAAAAVLTVFHALWTEKTNRRREKAVLPQEVFFDAASCAMTAVPAAAAS